MDSSEIRDKFLSYFENLNHKIYPSSSLVPDDPTLLLTAAGMVQFKPNFMGQLIPKDTRIATVQKCIRTTDIDNVGHTARHLTFFEMLGNFSFGDYYKAEAIPWAWKFLTEVVELPADKLWITVFRDDDEAAEIWEKSVGIEPSRIVRLGEADNFWDAGPTGPCGPCSEIVYDFGHEVACDRPDCSVGCDCDRYLEVWNLVFMQYDRSEKNELSPLPKKNIDTGLGLERLAAVLEGFDNNFETDLIFPLIKHTSDLAGRGYGENKKDDISMRIISDHLRAITFLIADGVFPSNEGRGYVLRRLIRRAVLHARKIGIETNFLSQSSTLVVSLMRNAYPELVQNQDFIEKILGKEEERFDSTLSLGMEILSDRIEEAIGTHSKVLSGKEAFVLHDTYGFPLELTKEIIGEKGLKVDEDEFSKYMGIQKETARKARKREKIAMGVVKVPEEEFVSEFVGYEKTETETQILSLMKNGQSLSKGEKGSVILGENPFYPEGGGQVGDAGVLESRKGSFKVEDTKRDSFGNGILVGEVIRGSFSVGDRVSARVNLQRRLDISRNHTATHLLQWALRAVIGDHIRQSGSLVAPDKFRFDFNHFEKISKEQISKIEDVVNRKIFEDHQVKAFSTTMEYAKDVGAIALFGEKYGDVVRLVEIGDFSKELCGGTHLRLLGEIGPFKVLSEGSIGANLRRIEAVTGMRAYEELSRDARALEDVSRALKVRGDQVLDRVEDLVAQLKSLNSQMEKLRSKEQKELIELLIQKASDPKVITGRVEVDSIDKLRDLTDDVREACPSPCAVVIGSIIADKCVLIANISDEIVNTGANAGVVTKEVATKFGGGGGGKANMAQTGGLKKADLDRALEYAKKLILERISGEKK